MPLVRRPGQPVDAPGDHPEGGRGRLCLSHFLAFVLLASLIGLSPLAYASQPDPVWIPGFYDDADHDEVLVFLANMGATTDRPPEGAGRLDLVVGLLLSPSASAPSHAAVLAFHLRSPPTD